MTCWFGRSWQMVRATRAETSHISVMPSRCMVENSPDPKPLYCNGCRRWFEREIDKHLSTARGWRWDGARMSTQTERGHDRCVPIERSRWRVGANQLGPQDFLSAIPAPRGDLQGQITQHLLAIVPFLADMHNSPQNWSAASPLPSFLAVALMISNSRLSSVPLRVDLPMQMLFSMQMRCRGSILLHGIRVQLNMNARFVHFQLRLTCIKSIMRIVS